LTDPEARFYFAAMMPEAALLPLCVAHNAAEKEALKAEIAQIGDWTLHCRSSESRDMSSAGGRRSPTSPMGIRVKTVSG